MPKGRVSEGQQDSSSKREAGSCNPETLSKISAGSDHLRSICKASS